MDTDAARSVLRSAAPAAAVHSHTDRSQNFHGALRGGARTIGMGHMIDQGACASAAALLAHETRAKCESAELGAQRRWQRQMARESSVEPQREQAAAAMLDRFARVWDL